MTISTMKRGGAFAMAMAASLVLAACGGTTSETPSTTGATGDNGLSGTVSIDGSSTVAPLSEAAATIYRDIQPGVSVTVATSGTGGGFAKFCEDETDISGASRPIKDEEAALCAENGIEYTEIVVANDGLSVVVNLDNDWAPCLTVEQLATMWGPESEGTITNWNQIDPSFPDQELSLFGAGTDSGTFDYFTDAINGEEGAVRTDYSPSEDDNITVQGVASDVGAVGFLGLSYVEENADSMKAVEVDGGAGCVAPNTETVASGEYSPLGRGLFIYVNNAKYAANPALKDFVDFYVAESTPIAEGALFVPLTDAQVTTAQDALASLG
jgi:phosphate binding protein